MGAVAWEFSFCNFGLGTLAWKLWSFGNVGLGALAWNFGLGAGLVRLGTLPSVNFGLGSLAWGTGILSPPGDGKWFVGLGGVEWGLVGVGLRAKRVAIWRTCPILWLGVGLLGEAGGAGGGLLGATFPQIHPAPGPQDAE